MKLQSVLWLLLQIIEGADKRKDTKGMERQTQGSCGGFDEVEVKVYSLLPLSVCLLNGSLDGLRSVWSQK